MRMVWPYGEKAAYFSHCISWASSMLESNWAFTITRVCFLQTPNPNTFRCERSVEDALEMNDLEMPVVWIEVSSFTDTIPENPQYKLF